MMEQREYELLFATRVNETRGLGMKLARRRALECGIASQSLDPEDIYHEAVLSMWRVYGNDEERLRNSLWFKNTLATTIQRKVIDIARSQGSNGSWKGAGNLDDCLQLLLGDRESSVYGNLAVKKSAADVVQMSEDMRMACDVIVGVLGETSDINRGMFVMRYAGGDKVRVIAERLKKPLGTVETTLFSLRNKMREKLQRKGLYHLLE